MKILRNYLDFEKTKTNTMYFLPEEMNEEVPVFALFTHGYTADKSSILNWCLRLTEVGVPCALFDIPGHYLGNYSEVESFEYFTEHAHELFVEAFNGLTKAFLEEYPLNDHLLSKDTLKLVLGGHSLGSLLALKAATLSIFSDYEKQVIGVGLGMAPQDMVHLFDSPFYKSTLNIREQLVSKALTADNVFPWIKEEKQRLTIKDTSIHLISGEDDLVVGEDGVERLRDDLLTRNNIVTVEKPSRLPHHEPQLAASYVKKFLRKKGWAK